MNSIKKLAQTSNIHNELFVLYNTLKMITKDSVCENIEVTMKSYNESVTIKFDKTKAGYTSILADTKTGVVEQIKALQSRLDDLNKEISL